ncbi:peptidylprolyl isomerase [Pseudomonas solani]|uniref:Peptidylprolyl isomerase n=1 Tax=Pseudomonas solani TaxID=2731552 RepID=A0AAU7XVF0_9PSED
MSTTGRWLGIGAIAAVALAVGLALGLRPGSGLEAAVQAVPEVQQARAASQAAPAERAVARLGELALGEGELQAVLDGLPAASREQLRADRGALEGWIRGRLAEKALLQQAQAQGWEERPEIQLMTRAATEQILLRTYLESVSQVPADYPSDAELQAAYEAGKDNWVTPPLYRVSQIFLAVAPGAAEEQVRKQAIELARRAAAANADFAALARQYSQDARTAEQGGDTGLQPLQQFVPAMRQVLARQRVGSVSEPLRSDAGYHILKLTEQQPGRSANLDEVRDRLRQALRAQRQEQVARAYLDGMVSSATLSIDGASLNQALEKGR